MKQAETDHVFLFLFVFADIPLEERHVSDLLCLLVDSR